MMLRMLLYYIEEFHLKLGKRVEGPISIDGEEKKAKIIATMNVVDNFPEGVCLQATEDATKWNECIAPEAFASMHEGIFSDENRVRLNLPPVSDELKSSRK
ncbi:unnamed protein product [Macrosiphum euphorbiae]|uniref:Uncharacterized protein n=1 Tax=Macrosiphum euphorbiae TaxID=13131 RepID=A0AAV0WKW6_9HEMI|nr:unnamed protein product [Macrosiphum euphorbiae]